MENFRFSLGSGGGPSMIPSRTFFWVENFGIGLLRAVRSLSPEKGGQTPAVGSMPWIAGVIELGCGVLIAIGLLVGKGAAAQDGDAYVNEALKRVAAGGRGQHQTRRRSQRREQTWAHPVGSDNGRGTRPGQC